MSCLTVEKSAEFRTPDDIFIKEMNLSAKGTVVAQHAHRYGHTTLLARGRLRAWRDGVLLGDYEAPTSIYIPGESKHAFMSLTPDTLAYCIHRLEPGESVEISAEYSTDDALRAVAA